MHKRILYALLVLITIPLGLGSRSYGSHLPEVIALYGGDVLAATCIFFGLRFLMVRSPLWRVALFAYLVCIAIETLQLWQAEWLVQIRNTWAGGVLLGHGFLWSDWICYGIGVLLGWGIGYGLEVLIYRGKTLRQKQQAFYR